MKITDALRGEHGVLYALFDGFDGRLAAYAEMPTLIGAADSLAASLLTHAEIEDALLFEPMAVRIGADGPIAVMRREHQEIEAYLVRAKAAPDAAAARKLVADCLAAARSHFAKEETVLFPMAESVLDEADLERLGERWAGRRGVALA